MEFRHEWKHEISYSDLLALRARLGAVLEGDQHAVNGSYQIRSLYFDNLADKALREKLNGVNSREKFRVRYYNGDLSQVFWKKEQVQRSVQQRAGQAELGRGPSRSWRRRYQAGRQQRALGPGIVLQNDHPGSAAPDDCGLYPGALCLRPGECAGDLGLQHPYGHGKHGFFKSGLCDHSGGGCSRYPGSKVGRLLPALIRDLVQVPRTHTSAFSKYAACRIYG